MKVFGFVIMKDDEQLKVFKVLFRWICTASFPMVCKPFSLRSRRKYNTALGLQENHFIPQAT